MPGNSHYIAVDDLPSLRVCTPPAVVVPSWPWCSQSMQPSAVLPSLQSRVCWETSRNNPSPPVASLGSPQCLIVTGIPQLMIPCPPGFEEAPHFLVLEQLSNVCHVEMPPLHLCGEARLGTHPEQENTHSVCLCFCIKKIFNAIYELYSSTFHILWL